MTGIQAQLRKDIRLNLAYEGEVRKAAPLGKIGNLKMTVESSPKARMPGFLERFVIFWKAIFSARKMKGSPDDQTEQFHQAAKHRVQKYTGELLGKLQLEFAKNMGSDHGKALLSIRKTLKKLKELINIPNERARKELGVVYHKALEEVAKSAGDTSSVRSGLEFLLIQHKSSIEELPSDELKILHEMAVVVGVEDSLMLGTLYIKDGENGGYKYYQGARNYQPFDERVRDISTKRARGEYKTEAAPDQSRDLDGDS